MSKTAAVALTGLFTALIALCAWLYIPFTVPVTLQTLAVCLGAAVLGTRRSLLAVTAYILLGMLGAPVFSGFRGGVSVIASPTGGYILGFLFIALFTGIFSHVSKGRAAVTVAGMATGTLFCYAFGTLWFLLFYPEEGITLTAALMTCVVPFLLPDALKITAAVLLSKRLTPLLKK